MAEDRRSRIEPKKSRIVDRGLRIAFIRVLASSTMNRAKGIGQRA
jgi:hypothetical protein